jgi:thymidine phosphorylase
MGKPTRAVLTAMEEPLGRTVGNALEVAESIACLKGGGPADTLEVTFALGEQMLLLAGVAENKDEARRRLAASITSGAALEKFRRLVAAQRGDARIIDDSSRLPQARFRVALPSPNSGYVREVDALQVARAALRLGAGRARAEDPVDPAVGVSGLVKVGERVQSGAPLCLIHANDRAALAAAKTALADAIRIGANRPAPSRLVCGIVR